MCKFVLIGTCVGAFVGVFGLFLDIDGSIMGSSLIPLSYVVKVSSGGHGPPGPAIYAVSVGGDALLGAFAGAVLALLRRKRKPGQCIKCSYNLTGNESGVCPECGTEIEAK